MVCVYNARSFAKQEIRQMAINYLNGVRVKKRWRDEPSLATYCYNNTYSTVAGKTLPRLRLFQGISFPVPTVVTTSVLPWLQARLRLIRGHFFC